MKSCFRNRFVRLLLCPVVTLLLEALPVSAVCFYGRMTESGTIERVPAYYSYFEMEPFGNGHFAPLITALLTCAALICTAFALIKHTKKSAIFARNLTAATAVISFLPLFIMMYSFLGALISALLCGQWYLLSKYAREVSDV